MAPFNELSHTDLGVEMHVPQRVIRPQLEWVATSNVPTRHGLFSMNVFRASSAHDAAHISSETSGVELAVEHIAMVYGDLRDKIAVPVRVHSECITSEVFSSLKCDCKEQLDNALATIVRLAGGMVIYLRQEGRGIGLGNKIRAYALQEQGHDTVDANRMLGLPDDARRYEIARDMLRYFGVRSIRLMTNNPEKISALENLGVEVTGRIPLVVSANVHSRAYLETKRSRMAHELPQLIEHQPD